MEEEKVGRSLSLSEILLVIRANIIWILIFIFASLGVGIAYVKLVQKTTYTATVGFYVNADIAYKEEGINMAEHTAYQYSALIAPEYEKVLKSQEMKAYLDEKCDKDGVSKLNFQSIDFAYTESSAFFNITYSYSVHGGNADEIKKELSDALNYFVKNTVEKLDTEQIDRDNDGVYEGYKYGILRNKLVVIAKATENTVSTSTETVKTVFLSLIVGIVLAAIFVLLVYFIDDTISSREDIERIMGVSTIAFIDISTNATLANEKAEDATKTIEEGK
ncbi:MAG: hypothetical protein IKV61_01950 [Clostridia bacterium]|nr:hypothetical protein [Clostridia bacterium]